MDDNIFAGSQGAASSFVAIGDSFTEGLNDPAPGGGFRGWADRLAGMLAAEQPGLRYANLAVRGKLLRQIVREQLPPAVSLSPSLVSIAGGGNDILRPGGDPDTLAELFDAAVARLTQAGCKVLMFTGFDPVGFPVLRLLRGRIAAYDMHLRAIADARGCYLVDLWSMRFLRDARAWSPDRLHLTAQSHQRVALRACEVLGVPVTEDWRVTPDNSVAAGPGETSVPVPAAVPSPLILSGSAASRLVASDAPASRPAGSRPASSRLAPSRLAPSRLVPSRLAPSRLAPSRLAPSRTAPVWLTARREDIRWAREYALPWVGRRLHRMSSGDGQPCKRPDLEPVTPP
jgi:lysophospholipase L1-like esterase